MKKGFLNGLCIFLTVLMLSSLLSTVSHASTEETLKQIVTQGTEKSAENDAVKVSKTIAPADEENLFTVTLKVTTTETLHEMSFSPDAAVVLVIDISNSMNESMGRTSRINAAKASANSFIESFAKEAQAAGTDTVRKVGIVTFGSTSATIQELTDIKTGKDQLKSAVARISTPRQNSMGGTNIEAGLTQAYTMLNVSGIAASNCYILLLSDGKPTYHNTQNGYSDGGSGSSTEHEDHYNVYNGSSGIADRITKAGMTVLSVYIGNENDRINCTWQNCSLNETIKNWLGRFSAAVYTATEEEKLLEHFENISKLITIYANAWRVEDPMGTYMEYRGLTADNDTVFFYEDTHTLQWNLRADTPVQTAGQEKTYAVSYRIKLLNTAEGFKRDTAYDTNKTTVLYYFLSQHAQEENPTLKQLTFDIPQVKGYLADVTFQKIAGDTLAALPGAVFSLQGENGINMTAVSAADGSVIFPNVPSGYSYYLTETAAPYGYETDNTPRLVTISYGTVTITGLADGLWINQVPTIDITAIKTWEDDDNNDGMRPSSITVQLLKDGNNYGNPVTLVPDVNGKWTHTWNNVPQYADGKEIVWSVKEKTAEGYSVSYETTQPGTILITNTHEKETISLAFLKKWQDDNNRDGLRPESVTVRVSGSADGDTVYSNQVVLSQEHQWAAVLTQLPKFHEGVPIQYTYQEDPVEGYSAAYEITRQGTILITNTHEPHAIPKNDGDTPLFLYGVLFMTAAVGILGMNRKKHRKE